MQPVAGARSHSTGPISLGYLVQHTARQAETAFEYSEVRVGHDTPVCRLGTNPSAFHINGLAPKYLGHAQGELHEVTRESLVVTPVVLQQELVPWALGYSDPVRERVEARRREAAGE